MRPRLDQVDLRLLGVFTTVVECGGFSAAQVELNVGQSTISAQMADLEAKLGMRLCERGRGGFRVTGEGRQVYESAQRLFRSLDSFNAEVEGYRGHLAGELHIGTVDAVITNPRFRLSQAIARFKRRRGRVSLTLHVGEPAEIERAIVDGRYHVGIGGYTNRIPGIEYSTLLRERQNLYCGTLHPLFRRDDATIDSGALQGYEFIKRPYVPDTDLPAKSEIDTTAVAGNMEAIALLILSGHFIGYLPVHYAAAWQRAGEMRALRPDRLHYESRYELLVRKGRPRQPAVDLFLRDLWREFAAEDLRDNA